jgi:hypothetical protein
MAAAAEPPPQPADGVSRPPPLPCPVVPYVAGLVIPRRGDHSSRLGAVSELGTEDQKIITLARSARARVAAAEGAAVRDETGRTYAAAAVNLPSLRLSALRLAVAMAVSSGAAGLEAAALVSDADTPDAGDLAAVRDAGSGAAVFLVGTDGALRATLTP